MPAKRAFKRITKTGGGPRGRSHMQAPKRAARRVPKPVSGGREGAKWAGFVPSASEFSPAKPKLPRIKRKLVPATRPSRGPASRSHMRRS